MSQVFARHLDAPFGQLDVRLKMAIGFSISALVVLADSLPFLAGLALCGLVFCALSRPTLGQVRLILFSSALLIWGLMFSQGLFYNQYPRTVLIPFLPSNRFFPDGLNIYREGIHYGLFQSLRMVAVMLTGYAVCFTTEPDRFFRGLLAMRMPYSLSFMAVTAIRFIPIVAQEFGTVRRAMRLKGYRPFRNGLRDTLRTEVSSLRPVLAGTIRRSEEVALSILTRGFAFGIRRTSYREARLGPKSWLLLAALAALVLAVMTCKTLFWLYHHQVYYSPALRPIYAFARQWL
ncbi:energy-coupling factor transporter transmembrane protein EcfT [bacterium]|nr:energy-coupling factor transporter transmembrane protein EcfT [bacterium]